MRAELAVPGRYDLHPPAAARASWWHVIASWIGERWHAFVTFWSSRLHIRPEQQYLAGDAIVVLCVAIVAIVGARLLMALQVARDRRGQTNLLEGAARSAHALALRAAREADAGDFAQAVRTLFSAAITLLDLRGVVRDDQSATINELRRALRERNASSEAPFVDIARIYVNAAYAERPVDRELWERAHGAYVTLAAHVQS